MNSMNEKERNASNGIAFIANMDGWTMNNFSIDYCFQFMMKLQGSVPTRVTHFLIVNPPSWFGKIWTIMRKMLLPSFQKKVHMIREHKLGKFLKPGYQAFLPSEMATGRSPTREIVQDFIDQRLYLEASRGSVRDPPLLNSDNVGKTRGAISETDTTESERTDMLDLSMLDLGMISEQLGVDEPVTPFKHRRSLLLTDALSRRTN
jgi:CRAL/TRIO domain